MFKTNQFIWDMLNFSYIMLVIYLSTFKDYNERKTIVLSAYDGFVETDDSYANMNYSTAKYIESLLQFFKLEFEKLLSWIVIVHNF